MKRRSLLTLVPSLSLLPVFKAVAARAAWRDDVSEVRFGTRGADGVALARAMQARLGVSVRAVRLDGAGLAAALNAGHLEFALLDGATTDAALASMGERLVARPDGIVVRQVLPDVMRADLCAALLQA